MYPIIRFAFINGFLTLSSIPLVKPKTIVHLDSFVSGSCPINEQLHFLVLHEQLALSELLLSFHTQATDKRLCNYFVAFEDIQVSSAGSLKFCCLIIVAFFHSCLLAFFFFSNLVVLLHFLFVLQDEQRRTGACPVCTERLPESTSQVVGHFITAHRTVYFRQYYEVHFLVVLH